MELVLMMTLKNMKIEAIASIVRKILFFVFKFIFPSSHCAFRHSLVRGHVLLQPGMYHRAVNAATYFNISVNTAVLPDGRPSILSK